MLSIATAWLHETSKKPLQIFDYPQKGWCVLRWSPGNDHEYTVSFLEFSAIVEERTGMMPGCVLVSIWGTDPKRVYSGIIDPSHPSHTESSLRKAFNVQGHRLTALMAVIHLALPQLDKHIGMDKWRKLIDGVKKASD